MNKDFLRLVLCDSKELFRKKEVEYIEVPAYDELSVKSLWPEFQKDEKFKKYFPD